MLLFLGGGRGRSIFWSIFVCQVLSTSSQCICAIVFWGEGGLSAKVYLSAKFYLIVVKPMHDLVLWREGGLSSTLCSSDKFCLVICNSSLCNWFPGCSLVMIYLSVSIYTSDFMYQCSNIVIHLLLLIHNYIWIAIIWHIHIYEHGDTKSYLQLKTHHISVICK